MGDVVSVLVGCVVHFICMHQILVVSVIGSDLVALDSVLKRPCRVYLFNHMVALAI